MLKRIIYTDFGQFIAALKSAEHLGLRYRVERRGVAGTVTNLFGAEFDRTWVEYTLDILPDEDAATGERATA